MALTTGPGLTAALFSSASLRGLLSRGVTLSDLATNDLAVERERLKHDVETAAVLVREHKSAIHDFSFKNEVLTFASAIATETLSNNTVYARVRESRKRRSAVIILPHWNSPVWSYETFTSYFPRLGLTAVELVLPYHGRRNREGARLSDYLLSPSLGRTIRSVRQAVIDTIGVIDWLHEHGYERIGLIGISLGSCIAGLVGAHDKRVHSSALLLTAGDFAEVVWTGRATQHIRQALEGRVELTDLQTAWSIISTGTFAKELSRSGHSTLILSGSRDHVVKPYLTHRFVNQLHDCRADVRWRTLHCGHYSLALFPFNTLAFASLLHFFRKSGLL